MKAHSRRHAVICVGALALLGQLGCHGEEHHHVERGKFLVTSPLKTDTDLVKDYVCQIHSIQHIELRALEKGYLSAIYVDEGQTVKKGQLMFRVMPMLYQAEYQKAQAEADFAHIEYKNTKSLADNKVVSPTELALARAKLAKAKAERALAKAHLRFTEVRAPFDGIMGRLRVRRGSLLEEGELLTTLADNSKMWVYFNVTEADYLDFKSRARDEAPTVRLMMANNQVFEFPGKVTAIEADFNNETGNIAFRATFPNPKGLLRHGETGKVLMTVPLKNVVMIPQKATFEMLTKKYVFVVDKENKVRPRQISIAEEMPHRYIVAKGLDASDKFLLEGLRKVESGDEIDYAYQDPKEVLSHLDLPAE